MPRTVRCFRTIFTEVVLYVGMFAIVGHLCQNLCERLMMLSEVKSMKSDLSSLETVLNNLGMAYESLRDEIQGILDKQMHKPESSCFLQNKKRTCLQCLKKLADVEAYVEENTNHLIDNFKKRANDFIQQWNTPANDETTITESTTFIERLLRCTELDKEDSEKEFCKCMAECISDCGKNYKVLIFQNNNTHSNQSVQNSASNWRLISYPV